jgi:putative phosphoribosyl transferase
MQSIYPTGLSQLVRMPVDHVLIEGALELPAKATGLVLFAHGSGSSRHSPRNNFVAAVLRDIGVGTLLMDLLTPVEDTDYQLRFDIALLTRRLLQATHWVQGHPEAAHLPIGYFGASTGAAAALRAAAAMGDGVRAVVSRGGRPDLAGQPDLVKVRAPTLLLVGGLDTDVLELNRAAYALLSCTKKLSVVPGATHLFEEAGTLAQVACQAAAWFGHHLAD